MKIINQDITKIIESKNTFKINLGCGESRLDNFYNLDIVDLPGVDVIADLNLPFSEFPDNCINELYSRASFEHVRNFQGLINEIQRICIPNAKIVIIVPHFSNPYYYSDPTHVQHFGLYTMSYYMNYEDQPKRKITKFYMITRVKAKKIEMNFYKEQLID